MSTAILPTTRLHLNKRETTFAVPLQIIATVALISVLISIIIWRSGGIPGTPEWIEGSQANAGIAFALPGFLIYLGVQSTSTTLPFALTLGTTRRAFVGGTLVWSVIVSAYLAVLLAALTLIELATQHWFAGFYIFDVYAIGAGDLRLLIPIVFLGTLTCLTLGGVFGAAWLRLGSKGPLLIGIGIVFVVMTVLIIAIPSASAILAAFELWWLAILAALVILLASLGSWLLLRSATIR